MTLSNILKIDYNKYINYLAVFYAFTIPLSRAGIVFSSFFLILLWLLEGNFKSKFQILKSFNFLKIGVILFTYLVLSSFWSNNISSGFQYFERFWYFGTVFVLITSLKKEYTKYLISAFIFAMFISEILSYGIVFEFWTLKHGTPSNPTPIMYHIEYSLFLAFTSLLLLNKVFLESEIKYKIFYGFFFISATGNLFLGAGRAGQLFFIITLFVLFISNMKNKIKSLIYATLTSFTILLIAYNISTTFENRVNIGKNDLLSALEDRDYSGSWGTRISTWIVTKEILLENPVFGTGIGDIKNDYMKIAQNDDYLKNAQVDIINAAGYHSDILEITAGGGIIALILFLFIFFYLYKLDILDQEYKNILIILITIFILGNIADNFLRLQFTMDLFSLFIAICAKQVIHKEEVYEKNFNN